MAPCRRRRIAPRSISLYSTVKKRRKDAGYPRNVAFPRAYGSTRLHQSKSFSIQLYASISKLKWPRCEMSRSSALDVAQQRKPQTPSKSNVFTNLSLSLFVSSCRCANRRPAPKVADATRIKTVNVYEIKSVRVALFYERNLSFKELQHSASIRKRFVISKKRTPTDAIGHQL